MAEAEQEQNEAKQEAPKAQPRTHDKTGHVLDSESPVREALQEIKCALVAQSADGKDDKPNAADLALVEAVARPILQGINALWHIAASLEQANQIEAQKLALELRKQRSAGIVVAGLAQS
jgi:hypothetical protein